MLIYEKKVLGERHLFGTMNSVPSNDDVQLTYKDNTGATILDIDELKFFYSRIEGATAEEGGDNVIYGNKSTTQIPTNSDEKINVWLGDSLIIGSIDMCILTCNAIENTVITIDDEEAPIVASDEYEVPKGSTVSLTIALEDAAEYEFDGTPTATANGESVTLTLSEGAYSGSIEVGADTDVVVTATVKKQGE